jgi:hypothetical protein
MLTAEAGLFVVFFHRKLADLLQVIHFRKHKQSSPQAVSFTNNPCANYE